MQLTPLQLEIQQRADKTLSFGCLLKNIDCTVWYKPMEYGTYITARPFAWTGCAIFWDNREVVVPNVGTADMQQWELTVHDIVYDITYRIEQWKEQKWDFNTWCKGIEIIWHPISRGRLCYLYFNLRNSKEKRNKFVLWKTNAEVVKIYDNYDWLSVFFQDNEMLYNKTVLERPVELQSLVLSFLKTLQNE